MRTGAQIHPGKLSIRACAWGVGAALAAVAAAVMSGLFGASGFLGSSGTLGSSGKLGAELSVFAWGGLAVAAVSGSVGMTVQTFMSTVPKGHPQVAERYLAGMVVNFLIQGAAVVIGSVALVLADVKFEATAAFGLTFAVSVTILHTVGVLVVSRALQARAAETDGVDPSVAPAGSVCGAQD